MVKKSDRTIDMVVGPSGSRIFGQISVGGRGARTPSTTDAVPTIKGATLPKVLPESDVGTFVAKFALSHGVKAVRTKLDLFAEAVTRMAGDDVKLDQVGQTLVALREKNLVSGAEMNKLMFNHLREQKRVRSVR